MQEISVPSLGWENPLEKEMAPHSSILAWEIPWTEEPSGLQSMGSHDWATKEQLIHYIPILNILNYVLALQKLWEVLE